MIANTCISLPIEHIMRPILSATLPLTPVSISSKIRVGIPRNLAIMALMESIILEISPPEATLDNSSGALPLAEKRKRTLSAPFRPGSQGATLTSKSEPSSSRKCSRERISDASPGAALRRCCVSPPHTAA